MIIEPFRRTKVIKMTILIKKDPVYTEEKIAWEEKK